MGCGSTKASSYGANAQKTPLVCGAHAGGGSDYSTQAGSDYSASHASKEPATPPEPPKPRVDLEFLAQVPLFHRLPADRLPILATAGVLMSYKAGEVIIRQGEKGDDFFLIQSGCASVKVTDSAGEKHIANLTTGDYFGEVALMHSTPRAATVEASTAIQAVRISRSHFQELRLHEQLAWPKRKAIHGGKPNREPLAKAPAPKTCESKTMLSNAIRSNQNLMGALDLNEDQIQRMVDVMWKEKAEKGKEVIKEGASGRYFYVVQSGKFDVTAAQKAPRNGHKPLKPKKLETVEGEGKSFGELALIHMTPHPATVTAKVNGVLWAMDRHSFQAAIINDMPQETVDRYVSYLNRVKSLQPLYKEEKEALARELISTTFKKDDIIVKQGGKGESMYILYEGDAVVVKAKTEVRRLSSHAAANLQIVGERALLGGETRAATVKVTSEEAKVLQVDKFAFDTLLGPLQEILKRDATDDQDEDSSPAVRVSSMRQRRSTTTKPEGQRRPSVSSPPKVSDYDGVQSAGSPAVPMSASQARPKATGRKKSSRRPGKKSTTPDASQSLAVSGPIKRADLESIGLLGCGGFGTVELVAHRETKETFALKSVSKGYILASDMKDNITNEKKILFMLNSPFIVKCFETYNSSQFLYFLMEPALGGELHATFHRKGFHGSEKHCRFYVAGAMRGIEHMHSKKVIYRDLKPENLLISQTGRLKVTDMGLAKEVFGKTYTCCGTPEYFAPETIACTGHTRAVDWWSLGVLIFELMDGSVPFEADDPMEMYAMIKKGFQHKEFPSSFSDIVQELIKALCQNYPPDRLAMLPGGTTNIKKHKWYKGFGWEAHDKLEAEPPYMPVVKSNKDINNFVATEADRPEQVEYKSDGTKWDEDFATSKD